MLKQNKTYLIIEDDDVDFELISRKLVGPTLHRAKYLSEAKKMMSDNVYDVIISDLGLPDSSQENIIVELLKIDPHMSIIVMTGSNNEECFKRCLEAGASGYFIKSNVCDKTLSFALENAKAFRKIRDHINETDS